jgi:hypothetical protein
MRPCVLSRASKALSWVIALAASLASATARADNLIAGY